MERWLPVQQVSSLFRAFVQSRNDGRAAFGRAAFGRAAFAIGLSALAIATGVGARDAAAAEPLRYQDVEALKQEVLALNRDLKILQEELLHPADSQVTVFLSLDSDTDFQLDSVTLKIDGALVASTLYTERQVDALGRGGVQRLYVGNLTGGAHKVTAFLFGKDQKGKDYQRGATVEVIKRDRATVLELQISDAGAKRQPAFSVHQWGL